ncbi:YraN family protein [Candidatus Uhrbacteria bacterium]|nr:YraN family protein [Candidatus Uhrbacteria bacterium]
MLFWQRKPKEPDWSSRREVGAWGERVALDYLKKKGYRILNQHWTHRIGEIDIVAQKDQRVIFVEVKTRTNLRFGTPEEGIGWHKQQKLRRTANVYMLKHKLVDVPYQIDALAIIRDILLQETKIRHLENVIEGR